MARHARERSESGTYHTIMRGINRQDIFYDEDDYQHFMDTVGRMKTDKYDVYGYCLMSNHIHLLLHEKNEAIHQIMKRIGSSYAWWYNHKYNRIGHVFQGRYGSECVEDGRYLLTVIRYIHKNPVEAEIVSKPEDYRWSSIHGYYGSPAYPAGLVDSDFILGGFAKDRTEAIERFREYMNMDIHEKCLEDEIRPRKTNDELRAEIEAMLDGVHVTILQIMEKKKRDEILRQIKGIAGVTQRQIARVTGLNQNIIFKA